ncbi:hypothetical protein GGE43_004773 [Agrobacterium tumefaciens]|uniref:hypothetical protein n=1 Tax=Agrobacterium radiobacter TaxID=362 RepID=UPI0010820A22|nr:hypothetical protein [Agrobacterium radiobacter]MBB4283881.1 hypothetical protein [Agrobacterium radiobacter]MBB4319623.1 hypothetical protein [Agrobacterium radiobacter]MBB4326010.1 hypothetical protein [Agrobacterium radiobacter]MBB4464036.1 hypothetical protein [Agrobacterium radiobacter]MBB4488123.1 hypothetical protein [Agrobacterium radiobacter]
MPEFSTDAEWRKDPSRHRPLGYSWRIPSDELKAVLDLPKMPTAAGDVVCEAIAADAIVSTHLYPGRRISYSRRAAYWAARVRYTGQGFNRDTVTLAVDKLVERGILIDHDRRPPGKRGAQSSYLPNPMLTAFEMPKLNKVRNETLILKDADGNMIGYKDTPETRDRRYTLSRVNRVLEAADIRIDREGAVDEGRWTRIDDYLVFPDHKSLHRIYNGGWTLGGRFYGTFWQNMRSQDRRHILIDGMETVEVDYDQLHARIIYAKAGKVLRGDAYEIEGWDRKIAKRAFFMVINAGNFVKAKGAVARLLTEYGLDPKRSVKLIDAMKTRHRDVSEFFHSGCGLQLQNLDSQMAEYVLKTMTVRKGIPCLPVHDSFIVPATATTILIRAMKDAYEKFVGKATGAVCSVKNPPTTSVAKTDTCEPQVHTYGSAPSEVPVLAPSTAAESGFENQESIVRNMEPAVIGKTDVSHTPTTQAPIRPVIKRTVAMPAFLREAQNQAANAWREEENRKRARRESRRRVRQMGFGGKDGPAAVQVV